MANFGAKPRGGQYEIGSLSAGAISGYDDKIGIYMRNWDLSRARDKSITVPLFYNAVSNLWESDAFDDYIVPEPGKPRMRRSALAELAQCFVASVQE